MEEVGVQTAYEMVWLSAQRTPNHTALIDDQTDRFLTYAEMITEIDIIAAGLREKGDEFIENVSKEIKKKNKD